MSKRQSKPFAPKPGAVGSRIEWWHFRTGQAPEVRSGIVIGQAPALGRGHKQELWVVPDSGSERDMYPGGVVVATRTGQARYGGDFGAIMPLSELPEGERFSDDRPNTAIGQLHINNWRNSAASTYQTEAA